jgi:transketolase
MPHSTAGVLPFGGTFLVFADYMRPPVRLAALSGAKAVFVWSHDSVGVGEDGPTTSRSSTMSLRLIPGLTVLRPPTPTRSPPRGGASSTATGRSR